MAGVVPWAPKCLPSWGASKMGCPVLDHLACKIPGTLEPRVYDVWKNITIAAGAFLPHQLVNIENRDAPWHLVAVGWKESTGPSLVSIQIYNARGSAMSDTLVRIGNIAGGVNALRPINPSYVWPINSALIFDLKNASGAPATFDIFFYGFKVFDRGKAPC